MSLNEQIHHVSQETIGKAAVGVGAGGSVIQAWTEYANLFVAVGNGALVLAGGYLMVLKIRQQKAEKRAAQEALCDEREG